MSISLRYPFKRVTYPGIDNPEFIGDVRVLTEGIMSGLAMLANLPAQGFAIVSGIRFVPQSQAVPIPYYTPGFFYLNGIFYEIQTTFIQGSYLQENPQSALAVGFNDGNARTIYTYYGSVVSVNDPGNGCPAFNGTMDAYRIGLDWLADSVRSLLTTQAALKGAAFLDVGTTAGTVMAGNDPRAPFTADQLDARYAQQSQVILKGDTTDYTPVNPLDPTNKKYVDASSARLFVGGITDIGDADRGGGTIHTISFGRSLPTTNYRIEFSAEDLGADPGQAVFYYPTVRNKTLVSFDIYFREVAQYTQHILLNWAVYDNR